MKEKNIGAAYEMYFDMVYRICYLYMNGCGADSEDACHQVFLKYMEHGGDFDSGEHEKAWLIVTAQNTCKSMLRRVYRKHVSLSEAKNVMVEDKADVIMEEILKLPEKEKTAIYLHYYEGYSGGGDSEAFRVQRVNGIFISSQRTKEA